MMEAITTETADYIITHYPRLLTLPESRALRHYRSTLKLEGIGNPSLTRMYLNKGRPSTDPVILNHLSEGYPRFVLNCAERILRDNPGKVHPNLCPVCHHLARTPEAKQCHWCRHDWH